MFSILHISNCFCEGLYGQPNAKKPKIAKQNFDNITPMGGGSIPSPVASQMSNMSNTNKIIKLIGGRDRGRKVKASKVIFYALFYFVQTIGYHYCYCSLIVYSFLSELE